MSQINLQQLYEQYQYVTEQLKILDGQIEHVNGLIAEVDLTRTTIEGLDKYNGDETIIPLGDMLWLKAKLVDPKMMIDLGSGVVAPLNTEEALKQVADKRAGYVEIVEKLSGDKQTLLGLAQQFRTQIEASRNV